jgi:hypothetical protein
VSCLEHEIELTRLGELFPHAARRTLVGLELVGAESPVTVLAFDERVAEPLDMAARLPHGGVHQDARVYALDVFAAMDHVLPPR